LEKSFGFFLNTFFRSCSPAPAFDITHGDSGNKDQMSIPGRNGGYDYAYRGLPPDLGEKGGLFY
jgi:hypothetical protein